jgi:hypothetical protein
LAYLDTALAHYLIAFYVGGVVGRFLALLAYGGHGILRNLADSVLWPITLPLETWRTFFAR